MLKNLGRSVKAAFIAAALTAMFTSGAAAQAAQAAQPRDKQEEVLSAAGINQRLEHMAMAVARAMKNEEARLLVRAEAERQETGDTEALLLRLEGASMRSPEGFRALLVQGHQQAQTGLGRSNSRAEAEKAIHELTSSIRNLHVAVRTELERWDASKQIPLVAYSPVGIQERDLREVRAYDAEGNLYLLDPAVRPDFPVLVVGINERTDADGNLIPHVTSVPQESSVQGVYRVEYVHDLLVWDDHESWFDGDAEITLKIATQNISSIYTGNFDGEWDDPNYWCCDRFLYNWYKDLYGPWAIYFWYERDSGVEVKVTVTARYQEVKDGSWVEVKTEFTIRDNDDQMGHTIVNYQDPVWQQYNIGSLRWGRLWGEVTY